MIISKEAKIGAVFFIAIVILVVFAVAVGAVHVGGGHTMVVYFDEVLGLEPGNDVWLYGNKVGSVSSLTHTPITGPDGKQAFMVKVVLNLDNEITLHDDYDITVMDKSVVGGRAVEIKAGTPGKRVHTGVIYGSSRGNPLASMGSEFGKSLDTLKTMGRIAADLQEGKGTLGMLLNDEKLYRELVSTTRETRVMLEMLTAEDSAFKSLLEDKKLAGDIAATAAQLKTAAERFAALMEKTNSPDSLVHRLVTDKALFSRLESLMENLDEFSETLRAGKGLGRMLTDDYLYNEIVGITAELGRTVRVARELIAEVQRDPQVLIAGRPTGRESWLVRQLRGEDGTLFPRTVQDARKLVPGD
ncbi:MAG: hypothetical protein DRP79_05640 [Planctomycetota bacterium]|nr:MAG: hypothetical protein DRP79_05640 [Planctomycetota bacterium]